MTRIVGLLVLAGVVIASPVSAQDSEEPRGGAARVTLVALAASSASLQAYDAYSTLTALDRGAAEANPAMRALAHRPAALVAVKAAVATSSIVASAQLWRTHHRKAAVILLGITNGAMAAVAVHNASVLRSMRAAGR